MPNTGIGSYEKKVNDNYLQPDNQFLFYSWQPDLGHYHARISMVRTGKFLSVYINKELVLDKVDFFENSIQYLLQLRLTNYFVSETRMYFKNFRLATGQPKAKEELKDKKVIVTQNIFFDVNSDIIKPSSYATLKEIAAALATIDGAVEVIGHTDSDGAAAANLVLSQKRAAAVKRALVNEFGLPTTKLTTSGKGQTEPLNANKTPAEKAQNRRVAFVVQ